MKLLKAISASGEDDFPTCCAVAEDILVHDPSYTTLSRWPLFSARESYKLLRRFYRTYISGYDGRFARRKREFATSNKITSRKVDPFARYWHFPGFGTPGFGTQRISRKMRIRFHDL